MASLEDKFARVKDVIIGLWRFRVKGEEPLWCCTYTMNGLYYDTRGATTVGQALDRVHRVIARKKKCSKKAKSLKPKVV